MEQKELIKLIAIDVILAIIYLIPIATVVNSAWYCTITETKGQVNITTKQVTFTNYTHDKIYTVEEAKEWSRNYVKTAVINPFALNKEPVNIKCEINPYLYMQNLNLTKYIKWTKNYETRKTPRNTSKHANKPNRQRPTILWKHNTKRKTKAKNMNEENLRERYSDNYDLVGEAIHVNSPTKEINKDYVLSAPSEDARKNKILIFVRERLRTAKLFKETIKSQTYGSKTMEILLLDVDSMLVMSRAVNKTVLEAILAMKEETDDKQANEQFFDKIKAKLEGIKQWNNHKK